MISVNIALVLAITLALFYLGYRFYASWIARQFGEDKSKPTPAVELNDGVDYVPTRSTVLFSHHFATIAGDGPIVGPTLALVYGVAPVWLWIVLGSIFIGAVHDYSSHFPSA